MTDDKYRRFEDLEAAERAGVDYAVSAQQRGSVVAIIAPHGGKIEPATSEIASAIAGEDFNLYRFEGLRTRPHWHLHVASTRFNEPQCADLIADCDTVIAVHGLRGRVARIDVGGRDQGLRDRVCAALNEAGISARVVTTGDHVATNAKNMCNRGRAGAGVQLEITRGLRDRLISSRGRKRMIALADAIRSAIG